VEVTEQCLIMFDLTVFLKSRDEGYPTSPRALRAASSFSNYLSARPSRLDFMVVTITTAWLVVSW
jgi:hypothetical protein